MKQELPGQIRFDLEIISNVIEEGSHVLDLGCGSGELLSKLIREKQCSGHGIEIHDQFIGKCIEKGVPVIHGNIDEGLGDYPDQNFDYVILSRTLQVVHRPDALLTEMLRVGKTGIVSFPNFGHIRVRAYLSFQGKMPVTKSLPYQWYDTPNIHLMTIRDFKEYCRKSSIEIIRQINLGRKKGGLVAPVLSNLFAHQAIFLIQQSR